MSQRSRARRSSVPVRHQDYRDPGLRDGACAVGLGDPDAFDADDCSLYAVADGDDDPMHMIEHSLGETCDCGNRIFHRNRCTNCGAQAPWASQLGCGLA